MYDRVWELARLVSKGTYVLIIGVCSGTYGVIELATRSKMSGWAWLAGGTTVLAIASMRVAYRALGDRDEARHLADSKGESKQLVMRSGDAYWDYDLLLSTKGEEEDPVVIPC